MSGCVSGALGFLSTQSTGRSVLFISIVVTSLSLAVYSTSLVDTKWMPCYTTIAGYNETFNAASDKENFPEHFKDWPQQRKRCGGLPKCYLNITLNSGASSIAEYFTAYSGLTQVTGKAWNVVNPIDATKYQSIWPAGVPFANANVSLFHSSVPWAGAICGWLLDLSQSQRSLVNMSCFTCLDPIPTRWSGPTVQY